MSPVLGLKATKSGHSGKSLGRWTDRGKCLWHNASAFVSASSIKWNPRLGLSFFGSIMRHWLLHWGHMVSQATKRVVIWNSSTAGAASHHEYIDKRVGNDPFLSSWLILSFLKYVSDEVRTVSYVSHPDLCLSPCVSGLFHQTAEEEKRNTLSLLIYIYIFFYLIWNNSQVESLLPLIIVWCFFFFLPSVKVKSTYRKTL